MRELIDTHTHLYHSRFVKDLDEVIKRSLDEGVTKVILPAIDSASQKDLEELATNHPNYAFATVGLHPTSVEKSWREELQFVERELNPTRHIAIGEIGIDCYWSIEFLKEQIIVFEEQLRLASHSNLPVIIHCRNSIEHILKSLKKLKHLNIKGVFHAYSGSLESFREIEECGNFMIGIGGVVTFNGSKLQHVVKELPLSKMLLETDSPWLTPTPHRGERNEPSYTGLVAQKVAQIKDCSIEEIAKTTTKNGEELFNLST